MRNTQGQRETSRRSPWGSRSLASGHSGRMYRSEPAPSSATKDRSCAGNKCSTQRRLKTADQLRAPAVHRESEMKSLEARQYYLQMTLGKCIGSVFAYALKEKRSNSGTKSTHKELRD